MAKAETEFKFNVLRESDIETEVIAWAENNGWVARKMSYRGRRGCRDVDFYGFGRTVMMEFKRPGGEVSAGQQREHELLAKQGVETYVFSMAGAAIALLKEFAK